MKQDTPISPNQPEQVARLLDALPGLVGAIDNAIKGEVGQPMPFVLLVFSGNGALHATNFGNKDAMRMVKAFTEEVIKAEADAEKGDADVPN